MIQVSDLVVEFGSLRAVDGLTLHVPAGRLFGLLGPNGAGKSTTIACIGGLLRPTRGSVVVDGRDVGVSPLETRRRIGIVPQRLALYLGLDVLQNLRIAGGLYGLAGARLAERVRWGLALARLEGRERAKVGTLSGGMQRRLNLACAILHDPPLVICDEPTTGVDPQSRNHLFETIRELHREGRTIVYTTHYMEEVEALCEDVAIVDHGKLLRSAPLAELTAGVGAPRRFTLDLVEPATEARVRAALDAAGLGVASLVPPQRGLEEVFLELTGHALRDSA